MARLIAMQKDTSGTASDGEWDIPGEKDSYMS